MKKLSLLLVFSLIVVCFSCVVYAYETSFEIYFTPESGLVTLKGEASGVVTVRVAESTADPQDFSDAALPADILQFRANGNFNFDFYMPDGSEKTKYAIYLTDKNGICKREFSYFIPADADLIVKTLESFTKKTEFISNAKSNAGSLGIDPEDEFMDATLSLMYDLYSSYDNSSDFYASYQYCRYISLLSGKDKAGVEELLRKYQSDYGINYSSDYEKNNALSSKGKENLCTLLSSMYFADTAAEAKEITGGGSFKDVYDCLSILATVTSSEGWVALCDIYTGNGSIPDKFIVSKNSSYKAENARNVFSKMTNMKFEKISHLASNFNQAVKDAQQPSSSGSKPSSGGGGGGGNVSVPKSDTSNLFDSSVTDIVPPPSASVPHFADTKKGFSDVTDSDWYYKSVSVLAGNEIINGNPDGSFKPNDFITRAEFAKLVVSTFDINGKGEDFSDVSGDAWYAPFISRASGASVITGYDGKFNPESNITRQDATVILYRVAGLLNKEYTGFREPADLKDASLYAWTAIGTFYSNDIIRGKGKNLFEPLSNITRAESAELIYSLVLSMQTK